MADHSEHKSAAELQRETELQRHRVENTIDQLQERLSPGQLVDELLSYGKAGGGEFTRNLGTIVVRNPLPVALLAVGLGWLIAKPNNGSRSHDSDRDWDRQMARNGRARSYGATGSSYGEVYGGSGTSSTLPYDFESEEEDYPYASVSGSMQRLGSVDDDKGSRFSEFVDDAGKKFRALTDNAGNRAGHFTDEAGNVYRGFTDQAGNRISQFRDEAGNILHEATGWASHTWRMAREAVRGSLQGAGGGVKSGSGFVAGHAMRAGSGLGSQAMRAGSGLQSQAGRAANTLGDLLQQQPLVGGAIAFAAGAALASTLPHTRQEDELLGDAADQVRSQAAQQAQELYSKGREQVSSLYETAQTKAADIYETAKDTVSSVVESAGVKGSQSDDETASGYGATASTLGSSSGLGSSGTGGYGTGGSGTSGTGSYRGT